MADNFSPLNLGNSHQLPNNGNSHDVFGSFRSGLAVTKLTERDKSKDREVNQTISPVGYTLYRRSGKGAGAKDGRKNRSVYYMQLHQQRLVLAISLTHSTGAQLFTPGLLHPTL